MLTEHPFGPYDSHDSYDRIVNETMERYLEATTIAQSTFQLSPDWEKLAHLFEAQPAVAALTTAKRIFGIGEGIVTKALERYTKVLSNFLKDEKAHPLPVLQSYVSIAVAIEMHLFELTGYKAALNYCQLVEEIDPDEYDIVRKDTLDQQSHIADMTAKAKAHHDQFLAEIKFRETR